MQDSIGGNCKAVIIANVSAAEEHASHTAHTLAFARRAKNIVNKVHPPRSEACKLYCQPYIEDLITGYRANWLVCRCG
jgi:Kinesin motor domain